MNIWLKSLLIGIAAAALVFFVTQKFIGQKSNRLFTVNYIVEIVPEEKVNRGDVVKAMIDLPDIIKNRCAAAGYSASIKSTNDNKDVQISITHV